MIKNRELSSETIAMIDEMVNKARVAMAEIENYSQDQLDWLAHLKRKKLYPPCTNGCGREQGRRQGRSTSKKV